MAMTYLTKLKPEPMGAHSLSTAYGVNSLVMSDDGAAAYISVKDVPAGTPLTNTEYWKIHTDLTSVKQSAEAAAQKANAARDEVLEIARNLTNMVEKSGNPVQAELVGGLPFDRVATALEPIQAGSGAPSPANIRTISGWTGAKLTRCGKNLLPNVRGATETSGGITFTNHGDGSYTLDGTANTYVQFVDTVSFWLAPGTYVLSGGYGTTSQLRSADGLTTFGHSEGSPFTFDVATEVRFRQTLSAGSSFNGRRFYPQLEQGSTASAYEPYQGDTYTADFGQTVYGGTLDWLTGVLTVDRAMVALTGNENITTANTNTSGNVLFNYALPGAKPNPDNSIITGNILCSHYTELSPNNTYKCNVGVSIGANGVLSIYDSTYTALTLDDFKAFLAAQAAAGTPVQVCYKLATPTTIQLTPQEIKQLQGANTLYGDGSISMTGRADKALALEARIAALEAAG